MPSNATVPVLEKPPPDAGAEAALASTLAIASVGIATLNMLETLLPAAAHEVERESNTLSVHFTTLSEYINEQEEVPPHVKAAISGIIMGMQFQDRNTQIMQNVTAILKRYRTMLQEISGTIQTTRKNHDTGLAISQAVHEILSGIRLSEIRTRYLEALRKAQVSSEKNVSPVSGQTDDASGTCELF